MRSTMLLGVFTTGMMGCAPPQSTWEQTYSNCGAEGWGDRVDPSLHPHPSYEPLDATIPHLSCIDEILRDFSVDVEAFEERDAGYMPRGRETFLDPIYWYEENSGIGNILLAARFLFVFDLGLVGDVEDSQLVRPGFTKQLRRVGGGRKWSLNEALYELLVEEIVLLQPASPEQEAGNGGLGEVSTNGNWDDGVLTLYEDAAKGGMKSLSLFVHEVRHDEGPSHRLVAGTSMDSGADGSYGWEAAMIGAVYQSMDKEELSTDVTRLMAENANASLERVEYYKVGTDTWMQTWEGFPWLGRESQAPWSE